MNDHEHEHGSDTPHSHGPETHGSHSAREHGHTHGAIDASILTSERGIAALRWSFVVMFATALIQVYVYYRSNSVGLLADTIHNFGDAETAIPLLDRLHSGEATAE